MKFSIICALLLIALVKLSDAQCPNVHMHFLGKSLSDYKTMTSSSNFKSLSTVYFDKSKKTVFYAGGWLLNYTTFDAQTILGAYMDTRRSQFNLVYVDWSFYSKDLYFIPMIQNMDCVANEVAAIIAKLRLDTMDLFSSVSPNDFHFIGFNYGAHLMAYTARKMLLPAVGRITGLDPGAALGFTTMLFVRYMVVPLIWRDANLVDIIHTSSGKFGLEADNGHLDFYVNGGFTQKGCSMKQSIVDFKDHQDLEHIYLLVCSHTRAVYYFAESVRRPATAPLPFVSSRCKPVYTYNPSTCDNTDDKVSMGFYAKNPFGAKINYSKRFYVETTSDSAKFSLT